MATTILSRSLTSVIASTTCTGSAVNVDLGYVPNHVRCVDVTAGDIEFIWSLGLNSASGGSTVTGYIINTAFATIAAGAGGITSLDGSAGNGIGFTIGTSTSINIAGHAVVCTAWR